MTVIRTADEHATVQSVLLSIVAAQAAILAALSHSRELPQATREQAATVSAASLNLAKHLERSKGSLLL